MFRECPLDGQGISARMMEVSTGSQGPFCDPLGTPGHVSHVESGFRVLKNLQGCPFHRAIL